MKKLDKGARKRLADETLSVESISDIQKILTPKRIEVLAVIKDRKPGSIYELAKMLKRKQENVLADVNFLKDIGLIEIKKDKKGRKKAVPIVDYEVLDFRVPLIAAVCLK